jgi:pantoate--beta-alanine ligase
MIICRNSSEARAQVAQWKREGLTVGFVPTMGFLHAGHVSLMGLAAREADKVVVSIFVNPTQFGPNEDYASYPRDEEGDASKCRSAGVDLLFLPPVADIYPEGAETFVECTNLPEHLCGLRRPGHFRGVTTVVAKLFCLLAPDVAVFGSKDYQQLKVLEKMTRDLLMPIRIVPGPTVREEGGLAMSSRNKYLSPEQRHQALAISRALGEARRAVEAGENHAATLLAAMARTIETAGGRVDYVNIFHPETLEDLDVLDVLDGPAHAAVAAFFGPARLIDNLRLRE